MRHLSEHGSQALCKLASKRLCNDISWFAGDNLTSPLQFLSIHSTYFAGLFTKAKQGQGRCELNEYDHPGTPDSMSDFDVVTAKWVIILGICFHGKSLSTV